MVSGEDACLEEVGEEDGSAGGVGFGEEEGFGGSGAPEVGEVVAAGEIGALYLGLKRQLEKEISRKEMFRLWKETRREFEYGVVASRLRGFLQQWCRFPE